MLLFPTYDSVFLEPRPAGFRSTPTVRCTFRHGEVIVGDCWDSHLLLGGGYSIIDIPISCEDLLAIDPITSDTSPLPRVYHYCKTIKTRHGVVNPVFSFPYNVSDLYSPQTETNVSCLPDSVCHIITRSRRRYAILTIHLRGFQLLQMNIMVDRLYSIPMIMIA